MNKKYRIIKHTRCAYEYYVVEEYVRKFKFFGPYVWKNAFRGLPAEFCDDYFLSLKEAEDWIDYQTIQEKEEIVKEIAV